MENNEIDFKKIEEEKYNYIIQNSPLKNYIDFIEFKNISKSYLWNDRNTKASNHMYPYFVWTQILDIVLNQDFFKKPINASQLEKYLKENKNLFSIKKLNFDDQKLFKKYKTQINDSKTNGAYGNTFFKLLYLPKNIKIKNNQKVPYKIIFEHIKLVISTWREEANDKLKKQIEKWLSYYEKDNHFEQLKIKEDKIKQNFRDCFLKIEEKIKNNQIKSQHLLNYSNILINETFKNQENNNAFLKNDEKNQQIGLYGEKIVVELLKKEYENNNDIVIFHTSLEYPFSPYDIEIYSKKLQKTICYVEVKSSINKNKPDFYISRNELTQLEKNNHRIYFIHQLEQTLEKSLTEQVIFMPISISYVDKFQYQISNNHYGFENNKFLLLPIKFKGRMPQ